MDNADKLDKIINRLADKDPAEVYEQVIAALEKAVEFSEAVKAYVMGQAMLDFGIDTLIGEEVVDELRDKVVDTGEKFEDALNAIDGEQKKKDLLN